MQGRIAKIEGVHIFYYIHTFPLYWITSDGSAIFAIIMLHTIANMCLKIFLTEYFQILPVGGDKVMISGFVSLRQPLSQLFLTIREDPAGVPDRYPRFREENEWNVHKVRI